MRRRLRVAARFEPTFDRTSSAYDVLGGLREQVRRWTDWPDVSAYDAWADGLAREARRPLLFRDVGRAAVLERGGYDRYVQETGLIPTRSRNWHDFFNAGVWCRLPRAKLALHAAQLEEASKRQGPGRTRRQDWLTHFDECGMLVVSDRPELLERIATLAWHELFVDGRAELVAHARVICFGHATLEALREPYVGLMGKALACHVPAGSMSASVEHELARADHWLAALLSSSSLPRLHPLPVLGLPGWHAANERPSFYDDPSYFRSRTTQPAPGRPT